MKNLTIRMITLLALSCLFVFASATVAFAQESDDPTLLEIIQSNPDLTTLATIVEQAGITATLSAPNANLTILAPNDDAFAALDLSLVQDLLADTDALQDVLFYHVISGTLDLVAITSLSSVTTIQGGEVIVGVIPNGTSPLPGFNNEAQFLSTNLMAENGIIHIIDTVLMPEATAVTLSNAQTTTSTALLVLIAVLSLTAVTPFTLNYKW